MNGGDCTQPPCTRDEWQSLGDMGPSISAAQAFEPDAGDRGAGERRVTPLRDSMGGLGRLCNLSGERPRKEGGGSPKLGVQGRKERGTPGELPAWVEMLWGPH